MEKTLFLYLLFCVELLLLLYALKKFNRVVFSPSIYTIGVFSISTILNIYCIDYWNITFYPITFIIISIGLITVLFAERKVCRTNHTKKESPQVLINIPFFLKIGLSLYSILATFLYFREVLNIGLAHAMVLSEAISNVKMDFDLYEKEFNPFVRQGYKMVMSIAYIYTFIFVNNYHICKQKFIKSFWFIIPLFSGVIINLISGSRGDMLRLLLLYLFFYYIQGWQSTNWTKQPIKKILKLALPSFAIMLFVFFAARLFVKTDTESQERIGGPIEYLAYYIGSPIQVLNIHCQDLYEKEDPNLYATFGSVTLNGLYSLGSNLGIFSAKNIKGATTGVGFAEIGGDSNAAGNVDTILGPPHVDYGLIGMIIYIYIIYYLISKCFYSKILYRPMTYKNARIFIIFSFFYYMIEMSFYSDTFYQIAGQTGILQFLCLLFMLKFVLKTKYFKVIST